MTAISAATGRSAMARRSLKYLIICLMSIIVRRGTTLRLQNYKNFANLLPQRRKAYPSGIGADGGIERCEGGLGGVAEGYVESGGAGSVG